MSVRPPTELISGETRAQRHPDYNLSVKNRKNEQQALETSLRTLGASL